LGSIFRRISLITLVYCLTPQGYGVPAFPYFGGSFLFMRTPPFCYRTTKFDAVKHIWGGGLFLGGQPRPHPKGAVSQRSPIFGVTFYLCIHPLTQNYQTDVSTRVGIDGAVFQGSVTPTPRGRGPSAPQFWGFSCIYAYIL